MNGGDTLRFAGGICQLSKLLDATVRKLLHVNFGANSGIPALNHITTLHIKGADRIMYKHTRLSVLNYGLSILITCQAKQQLNVCQAAIAQLQSHHLHALSSNSNNSIRWERLGGSQSLGKSESASCLSCMRRDAKPKLG